MLLQDVDYASGGNVIRVVAGQGLRLLREMHYGVRTVFVA
jgi:hypothetical protein